MKFSNKKIAVLGLGIEGQDVSQYLLKKKAKITVFDQKTGQELGEVYQQFKKKGIEFRLGEDYFDRGLVSFDFVFRSPAFRRLMPEILQAEKKGVVISSATKLFFALSPAKIIGVTGTKGKGTTATLIYRILKKSGKKVFLAGNIGQPMLALLPKLKKDSWVVLELSSFQLQDLTKSPHIAVVLFITSEHLDYHQDEEEYIQAKSNIVRHQKGSDLSVLNGDNFTSSSFASLTEAKVYYFSKQKKVNGAYVQNETFIFNRKLIGSVKKLQLRGKHNWDNVCAAITASSLAGADLASIKKVVFSFSGLEHRLEKVKVLKGVSFYNDSFSTTPETAIAAIKAFEKPIILIAGGSEKGSDFTNLGQKIAQSSVKTLILIGQMATRIKKAVNKTGFKGEIIFRPGGMKEIVKAAFEKAKPKDVVLLSPACASFDMFANYKVRGKQFKTHVKAIKINS
jgi:UDP-N-acetylmuramoylalanine--D-glutamate ligase